MAKSLYGVLRRSGIAGSRSALACPNGVKWKVDRLQLIPGFIHAHLLRLTPESTLEDTDYLLPTLSTTETYMSPWFCCQTAQLPVFGKTVPGACYQLRSTSKLHDSGEILPFLCDGSGILAAGGLLFDFESQSGFHLAPYRNGYQKNSRHSKSEPSP